MVRSSKISFAEYIRSVNECATVLNIIEEDIPVPQSIAGDSHQCNVYSASRSSVNDACSVDFALALCVPSANDSAQRFMCKSSAPKPDNPMLRCSEYSLVMCPLCLSLMVMLVPSSVRIPTPFAPILSGYVRAVPSGESNLASFDMTSIAHTEDMNDVRIASVITFISKDDFRNALSLVREWEKDPPCQISWIYLLKSHLEQSLGQSSASLKSYQQFLDTFPIASHSIGLLIHWNKYIVASSARVKKRELSEIHRYRRLTLGNLPSQRKYCLICGIGPRTSIQ